MAPLNPTSNKCYAASFPDSHADDRFNLKVRTGAATCIVHSRIFVHGGLTVPLELQEVTMAAITEQLTPLGPEHLSDWISNEVFELNIVERKWTRREWKAQEGVETSAQRPAPRIFHSMACQGGDLYISGGLVLNSDTNELEPINDLWKYDLSEDKWTALCMGIPAIKSRFAHTLLFYNTASAFNKKRHLGLLAVGGRTKNDTLVPEMDFLDLVEMKWVSEARKILPIEDIKIQLANKTEKTQKKVVTSSTSTSAVTVFQKDGQDSDSSIVAYTKMGEESTTCPLIGFPLSLNSPGKRLPILVDSLVKNITVPFNLSYSNMGSFGDHLIVMGFDKGNNHISIYLYHKPSGRWTTLKLFCDHESFSHQISRGYVWASHHRLLLLGNSQVQNVAPSVQYFNLFMTVSLPFVNVFGSSLYYNGLSTVFSSPEQQNQQRMPVTHHKSFIEYSKYVTPDVQMTSIKSAFPQYAVTLGRNAFDRFGFSISDFEFVSADGDHVPIPSMLCRKRWGRCFEMLIAKGYVRAVDNFEKTSTKEDDYFGLTGEIRVQGNNSLETPRDSPHFRYPFQESSPSKSETVQETAPLISPSVEAARKLSAASSSSLLTSSNPDLSKISIPDLKPQPTEPAPPLPLPRQKSNPIRTPSASSSPRGSISGGLQPFSLIDRPTKDSILREQVSPNRRSIPGSKDSSSGSGILRDDASGTNSKSISSFANTSLVSNKPSTKFVAQQLDVNSSKMEPLLLPRSIYLPFTTTTVRALAEFFATAQVGNKWPIIPTTLDVILISKFYEIPLLYDLILEILYSIIGNKENQIIADANELSHQFVERMSKPGEPKIAPPSITCLEGFPDFLAKFNDGVLDLSILKRLSKNRKESFDAGKRKRSEDSGSSSSSFLRLSSLPAKSSEAAAPAPQSVDDEIIEEGDPRYKENVKSKEELPEANSNSDSSSSSDGLGVGIGMVPQLASEDICGISLGKRSSQSSDSTPMKKSSGSTSSSKFNSVNDNTWPNLGQLTAPNAPACTDLILDFIYEIGALAGDMKLMVRAANVLDISQRFEVEKRELTRLMENYDPSNMIAHGRQVLKATKSLFGKLDLTPQPSYPGKYEKRGSISSVLSAAESGHSIESNSRHPLQHSSQLSSNALERSTTFDSIKSLAKCASNLKTKLDSTLSPQLTNESTKSQDSSSSKPRGSTSKSSSFLSRK